MNVEEAQREVRTTYMGGMVGQLVSGTLWLISAAVSTWASPRSGILVLCLGGALIFPVTQLVLRVMGRPTSLPSGNPLRHLAMQIAFTVPLGIPLVLGATLYRLNWFYPAFMILVGAHYLPFVFLYGLRLYAVLCAFMVGGGILLGLYMPGCFRTGGWLTGGLLVLFAIALRWEAMSKDRGTRTVT
jgi:hypothetical protein